uniref:CSON007900 protein n=1 Tax=Culicoides sonorensis TaxID=179676 RepID=A0A336LE20_CULSO
MSTQAELDSNIERKNVGTAIKQLIFYTTIDFWLFVTKLFAEYCNSTTIHGFSYISDRKKYVRKLWIMICIVSFIGCSTQIYELMEKWQKNPTILVFDQKFTSMKDINFPAITVCGQRLPSQKVINCRQYLESSGKNYNFHEFSKEKLQLIDFVAQLCWIYATDTSYLENEIGNLSEPLYLNLQDLFHLDTNFISSRFSMPACSSLVDNKKMVPWNCYIAFNKFYMYEGQCYTFNMNFKDKIIRENVLFPLEYESKPIDAERFDETDFQFEFYGFDRHLSERPLKLSKAQNKIKIAMNLFDDFNNKFCKKLYVIYVHDPDDVPWNDFYVQTLDFENFSQIDLIISPTLIDAADDLRKMSPEKRNCCFKDECKLDYFKIYSKNNCLMECYTKMMYHKCNCTTFELPRTDFQRICTIKDLRCTLNFTAKRNDFVDCNCLDECNLRKYNVKLINNKEVASVKNTFNDIRNSTFKRTFHKQISFKKILSMHNISSKSFPREFWNNETAIDEKMYSTPFDPGFDVIKYTPVSIGIQFESSEVVAMQRISTYTFVDFVAQIGGLLGLFMGISLLSCIEILYFCTIRLMKPVNEIVLKPH